MFNIDGNKTNIKKTIQSQSSSRHEQTSNFIYEKLKKT